MDVASKIQADVEPHQKLLQIKHLEDSFVRNAKYFTGGTYLVLARMCEFVHPFREDGLEILG